MISTALQVIALTARMLHLFPGATPDRALATARAAVRVEELHGLPAEMLVAIAEHESDLRPNAVSYVRAGARVDILWNSSRPLPSRVVCGYLQAMASPSECAAMIAVDGGMSAGAAELAQWMTTCRGDLRCALRGHAGGTACALRSSCSGPAAAFARLFYRRAVSLGMLDGWRPSRPSHPRSAALAPLAAVGSS